MPRTLRVILAGLLAVVALTACRPVNPGSPPQPANPLNRQFYVDITAGYTTRATNGDIGQVYGLGTRNAAVLIERLDVYDMADPKKQVNHPKNGYPPLPIINDRVSTYGPNRYGINFNIGDERGWRYPFEVERTPPGHTYQVYVKVSTLATKAGEDVGCRIWEFGGGALDDQITEFQGPLNGTLYRTISVTCHGQIIT